MPRERLAALFWPEHGAEAARRNLRKVLYRLREQPALPLPEEQGGALRWQVPTDLQRLEQALAAGELEAVAAAWPLQPFDGLDGDAAFGEWLQFERQRLRSRWRQALLGGIDGAAPEAAMAWAVALREADPLDEAALRALLGVLARSGRLDEARDEYQRFEVALTRDLAARPSAETRALVQALLQRPAAPAPVGWEGSGAAAAAATGLVGRQAEQRELLAWAARPAARWLSVVGPGGIGKTRLVRALLPRLQAAAQVPAPYVALEDLADAAAIPARVAEALALGPAAASWPGLALALALAPRPLLLVLDNLEPLLAAVPALQQLLAEAPGLRLLVTTRERCQAREESVLALAGLPWPDAEDLARAAEFDAVQLFVQAAQRQRADFTLAAEPAAVVALCHQVEGWPLALELAAAWTRHLRVEHLLAMLRDGRGAEVLSLPPGATPSPRQAGEGRGGGLMALLATTFERLAAVEQRALMQLSLLDTAFGSEAALAVGGVPLALLVSLADKSLLRQDAGGAGGPRWSMHALVRSHAAQQLQTQPALLAAAQEGLCALMCQRAAAIPPRRHAAAHRRGMEELLPELGALQQAWRLALQARRPERLAALQRVLSRLMMQRSEWRAAQALLEPAQALLQGQALAQLQATLSHLLFYGGSPLPGAELARQALRVLRRGGDAEPVMQCLWIIGQGATRSGGLAAARRCFEEGLALARAADDADSQVSFIDGLSGVAYALGRHDEQIAWLEQGIALAASHGGRPMVSLSNLGNALRANGRIEDALAAFARGLALAEPTPERYRRERATLLCNRGLLLGSLQRVDEAAACAREGLAAAADGVDPMMELHLLGLLAGCEREQGRLAEGGALLRRALAGARQLGLVQVQLWLLQEGVRWLQAEGRVEQAARVLGAMAAHPALQPYDGPKLEELRQRLGVAASPALAEAEAQGRALAPQALIDSLVAAG